MKILIQQHYIYQIHSYDRFYSIDASKCPTHTQNKHTLTTLCKITNNNNINNYIFEKIAVVRYPVSMSFRRKKKEKETVEDRNKNSKACNNYKYYDGLQLRDHLLTKKKKREKETLKT